MKDRDKTEDRSRNPREAKGFDFIRQDNGGPDSFVYFSAIKQQGSKTLKDGELGEFEIQKDFKGQRALIGLHCFQPLYECPIKLNGFLERD
ncbi:cold shock domain-containing protein [Candidatus Acetothermia bacterium]|nr:cold shock domain-containing protein [Candidatus Acetothermia bacterium]MBI3660330.1 cold shock domain-containing protein [Candidatus Acetothermia bacterium]